VLPIFTDLARAKARDYISEAAIPEFLGILIKDIVQGFV